MSYYTLGSKLTADDILEMDGPPGFIALNAFKNELDVETYRIQNVEELPSSDVLFFFPIHNSAVIFVDRTRFITYGDSPQATLQRFNDESVIEI